MSNPMGRRVLLGRGGSSAGESPVSTARRLPFGSRARGGGAPWSQGRTERQPRYLPLPVPASRTSAPWEEGSESRKRSTKGQREWRVRLKSEAISS